MKTKIEIIAAPQVRAFVIRNTVIDDNGKVVKQTAKKCNSQDATFVFEGEAVKETIKSRYFGTEPEAVDFLAVKDAEDMDYEAPEPQSAEGEAEDPEPQSAENM